MWACPECNSIVGRGEQHKTGCKTHAAGIKRNVDSLMRAVTESRGRKSPIANPEPLPHGHPFKKMMEARDSKECGNDAFDRALKKSVWRTQDFVNAFADGWLAAHSEYAPKLTKKEAVEKTARAICLQEHKGHTGMDSPEEAWASWHANYETLAEAALYAAGVRFKEEA